MQFCGIRKANPSFLYLVTRDFDNSLFRSFPAGLPCWSISSLWGSPGQGFPLPHLRKGL